jgi:hypothetical protein
MRIFHLTWIVFYISACSGSADFGGPSRSEETESEDEEEEADVPEEISGAFLVCDFESEINETEPYQTIGCAAKDNIGNRYPADHDFELTLNNHLTTIPIQTTSSSDPMWDVMADIPTSSLKLPDAKLKMNVFSQTRIVASPSIRLSEVGQAPGNPTVGYAEVSLTQFKARTSWTPKTSVRVAMDESGIGLLKQDFCDHDGARLTFGDLSLFISKFSENWAEEDLTEIKLNDKEFTNTKTEGYCFKEFAFSGTQKAYVHQISVAGDVSCYALKIGATHYFVDPLQNTEKVEKALSLESLNKFVTSTQNCGL